MVLLAEYEPFVEPFLAWELNKRSQFETAPQIGYFFSKSCLTNFSN